MKKFISKILCYVISLQLCTSCMNSAQVHVQGSDAFRISGLIAQSLQNVTDMIFPSAMAATRTGVVYVYTVDKNNQLVEIAQHDLYDNAKRFSFEVPKNLVNEAIVYFDYREEGDTDRREKFEVTDPGTNSVYTVLTAETTFKSDILQEVIAAAITEDPDLGLEGIKEIVRNYREEEFEAAVDAIGGFTTYVNTYTPGIPNTNIVRTIIANKNETDVAVLAVEFRPELLAAAYAKVEGAKLDCANGATPTVVNSSSDDYEASLYFSTQDAATQKALGYKTKTITTVTDDAVGSYYITKWLDKFIGLARQLFTSLKGSLGLLDSTNNVLTTCNFTMRSGTIPISGKFPKSGSTLRSGSGI